MAHPKTCAKRPKKRARDQNVEFYPADSEGVNALRRTNTP
jgi:hypothetical protein